MFTHSLTCGIDSCYINFSQILALLIIKIKNLYVSFRFTLNLCRCLEPLPCCLYYKFFLAIIIYINSQKMHGSSNSGILIASLYEICGENVQLFLRTQLEKVSKRISIDCSFLSLLDQYFVDLG